MKVAEAVGATSPLIRELSGGTSHTLPSECKLAANLRHPVRTCIIWSHLLLQSQLPDDPVVLPHPREGSGYSIRVNIIT